MIDAELNILFSFPLTLSLNTFAFIFFTLFGTQTPGYGSLVVLQLPPHLLKLTVNGLKRVSLEFILISVGVA